MKSNKSKWCDWNRFYDESVSVTSTVIDSKIAYIITVKMLEIVDWKYDFSKMWNSYIWKNISLGYSVVGDKLMLVTFWWWSSKKPPTFVTDIDSKLRCIRCSDMRISKLYRLIDVAESFRSRWENRWQISRIWFLNRRNYFAKILLNHVKHIILRIFCLKKIFNNDF